MNARPADAVHGAGSRGMRSTIRRVLAASAAVAALALTAILAVPAVTAQADPAPGQNLGICHATHSDSNPYVAESPNINATGLKGGHADHVGPIWDPTLKAQHISWGDIIPPFDYTEKDGGTQHFDGLNWTPEGQKILQNDCKIPAPVQVTEVSPQAPVVAQSVCVAGQLGAPSLRVAADTDALTYGVDPAGPYAGGQQVMVTASLTDSAAYQFGSPLPAGWTAGAVAGTATWTVSFDADPPCDPPAQAVDVPNTDPKTPQPVPPATAEPDSSVDYGISAESAVRAQAHTNRALAVTASKDTGLANTGLANTGIPVLPLIGAGAGLAALGLGTLVAILLAERRRRA